MKLRRVALLLCLSGLSTSCLMTRSQVSEDEEKKVIQSQVNQLQKTKADQDANLQSYEAQIRMLHGRIETLEHQVTQLSSEKEQIVRKLGENDERFRQLEQALLQVEQGQSVHLQPAPSASDEAKKPNKKTPTLFDDAEDLFAQKQWKKAVVLYQKYRDKYPNGGDIAAATLKMGLCFHEMKMNKEARVFFEEVVEKFPKTKYAKVAQTRLTQKKK